MSKILLIDDERNWLHIFKLILAEYGVIGYDEIFTAVSGEEAFIILKNERIDAVFLDLMMGRESGIDILEKIRKKYKELPVVMMTGVDNMRMAVSCVNKGASDYLVKTIPKQELIDSIVRILESSSHIANNTDIQESCFECFITKSPQMFSIFRYMSLISKSSGPVLITGESGTGKGIIAKCFADVSRPDKPFVPVNVSGIDDQVFSDTLFGHVKGAFTGADGNRQGMISKAEDGILFLDEIGDLPMKSQVKLLYLTQEGVYHPLGSDTALTCNARMVFATNQDLELKQKNGEFRQDLYYRISAHHIHIPPLRERREDIPLLIKYFSKLAAIEYEKSEPEIPTTVMMLLKSYDFPGNTRQLKAMVHDLVALSENERITITPLRHYFINERIVEESNDIAQEEEEFLKLDELIDRHIKKALELSGGNQRKAAEMIGLSPSALNRRLKS